MVEEINSKERETNSNGSEHNNDNAENHEGDLELETMTRTQLYELIEQRPEGKEVK